MIVNKTFLDTNIIVYAYDSSARSKHETAKKIMKELWGSGQGIISTQVLQEFYVSVTKKIPKPLDMEIATHIIKDLMYWDVVVNDGEAILEAIEIQARHRFSFWDSLVIQAAVKGGAEVLFSENLNSGQIVSSVEIKNPFLD